MNHLAGFLVSQLHYLKIKQQEFAARLGMTASHLSHIIAGRRKWLDKETVAKMMVGFSDDPRQQFELLRVYLLDQCPEESDKLVNITYKGDSALRLGDGGEMRYGTTNYRREDPVADFARQLREMEVNTRLIKALRELALVANSSPELQRVLEDLTKLEIQSKKKA